MEHIGTRVKELRQKEGLKQIDFAKKVLVSSSYISKVEAGKEIPSDIFLKLISLEFGISYDWLKTGDDNSKEAFTKVENVTHINKIKEVRKKNNMTQQEFANSLGISRPHLSKIESSKENASDSVIKLISKLYDVSYDWLTSLDETCADEAVANTKHCKEVMNNKIFIGMEIKNIRNKFGLSQRDFGKRLGVTHAYISRIESGKENPSETLLKLLSYEFGTDGTDIMSNSKLKLLYEKLDMAMSNTELAMNYMKQCISLLENHVK